MEHLKRVTDPRVKRTRRHELMDILAIALCAVSGGADDWVSVVHFAKSKQEWFSTFLKLPNGIASHYTFVRVFQILDSKVLERVCIEWLQSICEQVHGVVAIDGKSLCGSREAGKSPLHIVSAWACQKSMRPGQVQTDKKSNEITAIPELLKLLSIRGCIVKIDAVRLGWSAKARCLNLIKARSLESLPLGYRKPFEWLGRIVIRLIHLHWAVVDRFLSGFVLALELSRSTNRKLLTVFD